MEIKDTIMMDDNNEYVVVSKAEYENKIYYLLKDIKKIENIMIGYYEDGNLIESIDGYLNAKLLPLFLKNTLNEMKEQK